MATTFPKVMDTRLSIANSPAQSTLNCGSTRALWKTLSTTAKPAALLATDRYAVTGVGDPSYTSGTHIWRGTAAILNPKPATNNIMPSSTPKRYGPAAEGRVC